MVFSHIHSAGDFPLLILLPSTPTFTPQVSQNRKKRGGGRLQQRRREGGIISMLIMTELLFSPLRLHPFLGCLEPANQDFLKLSPILVR